MPHWDAVRRVYRYLISTKELHLTYGGEVKPLAGYTDADRSMAEDHRAISGYAFLIDGGAVSWSSKKQEIVSLSTTESKYIAATHAAKEALWLHSLISELFAPLAQPVTLFSDNQSAIALAKDHQYHARTKHIDVCFHFIHWVVNDGKLHLIFCPTDDMVADTQQNSDCAQLEGVCWKSNGQARAQPNSSQPNLVESAIFSFVSLLVDSSGKPWPEHYCFDLHSCQVLA